MAIDILHVSDKLLFARLPRTICAIFPLFLIFCCYFTRLKACETSLQNMKNLENIGLIALTTVRLPTSFYNKLFLNYNLTRNYEKLRKTHKIIKITKLQRVTSKSFKKSKNI